MEAALSGLERALELLPERFEARYHRGRALLLLGRGPEAVRELKEALRMNPGFAPARVLRPRCSAGARSQSSQATRAARPGSGPGAR